MRRWEGEKVKSRKLGGMEAMRPESHNNSADVSKIE